MDDVAAKNSPTATDIFLSNIKSRTAALHGNLERTRVSAVLMSPAITQDDYVKYLKAMRAVVAWYETYLFPSVSSIVTDLDKRKKLWSLDKDIQALSSSPSEVVNFTSPESLAERLGYMYVIEGSTLGGVVIAKQLAEQSFISPETTNFLNVYHPSTGRYWKTFIQSLSTYAVETGLGDQVIKGAQNAFQQIYNYFISLSAE